MSRQRSIRQPWLLRKIVVYTTESFAKKSFLVGVLTAKSAIEFPYLECVLVKGGKLMHYTLGPVYSW